MLEVSAVIDDDTILRLLFAEKIVFILTIEVSRTEVNGCGLVEIGLVRLYSAERTRVDLRALSEPQRI